MEVPPRAAAAAHVVCGARRLAAGAARAVWLPGVLQSRPSLPQFAKRSKTRTLVQMA